MIRLHESQVNIDTVRRLTELTIQGQIEKAGLTDEFEHQVLEATGLKKADGCFCIATADNVYPYVLALSSLGVSSGDEIIAPSLLPSNAVLESAKHFQATIKWADIDRKRLTIDPDKLAAAISPKTKCIIAIDHDSNICDHKAIAEIGNQFNLPVIHDASRAFGARCHHDPIGQQHVLTAISCTPADTLNCVEGGALIGRDLNVLRKIEGQRGIRLQNPRKTEQAPILIDQESVGMSYRMSPFYAGIGIDSIKQMDASYRLKADNALRLEAILRDNSSHSWYQVSDRKCPNLFCIAAKNTQVAQELRKTIKEHGIECEKPWRCQGDNNKCSTAQWAEECIIYLPIYKRAEDIVANLLAALVNH
jgi:dTDP-4-amino-4,6-dideoxygalactose transaminase